jgi:hypothetical protein
MSNLLNGGRSHGQYFGELMKQLTANKIRQCSGAL